MNETIKRIDTLIKAKVCVVVKTEETERVIFSVAHEMEDRPIYIWEFETGLVHFNNSKDKSNGDALGKEPGDVLNIILNSKGDEIYFLCGFVNYMTLGTDYSLMLISRLKTLIRNLRTSRKGLIIISETSIPYELSNDVNTVDFPRPTIEELKSLIKQRMEQSKLNIKLTADELELIANCCKGLTLNQSDHTISSCLIEDRDLIPEKIMKAKIADIMTTGYFEHLPAVHPDSIGGCENLKEYIHRMSLNYTPEGRAFKVGKPKGVLFGGISGEGKTLFAKAVSHYFRIPALMVNVSKLYTSEFGGTEKNASRFISIVKAYSPLILLLNEADKQLGGVSSSDKCDAGTKSDVFRELLELAESEHNLYIILTCNNVHQIPAELCRPGRIDETFFFDLSNLPSRKAIFAVHLQKRDKDSSKYDVDELAKLTAGYTGADIEKVVNTALNIALFEAIGNKKNPELKQEHLMQAVSETVPFAKLRPDEVEEWRAWQRKTGAKLVSKPDKGDDKTTFSQDRKFDIK